MNILETTQVLAKIQAFTTRKVDEAVIMAWHEVLAPCNADDCLKAVSEYFTRSKEWIMPVDILDLVKGYRGERIREFKDGLRLSDEDQKDAFINGRYGEASKQLYALAGNGHLTPAMYTDYQAGKLQLSQITPKELTK